MSSSSSQRALQLARWTQEHLHDIFLRQHFMQKKGTLVSVSKVEYTPDLSNARVYISVYPEEARAAIWEDISVHTPLLQKLLHQALRHQLRKMPQFIFVQDDTMERAGRMFHLIDNL